MNEPQVSLAWWRRPLVRTLLEYGFAFVLCMLVLGWVYDLRRDVRNMPFYYQGDTLFYHITTKVLTERGWYQDVPLLGAPGTLNLREVPSSDNNFHFLTQLLFVLKTKHYLSVLNNFFLLGFPLCMLCALFALRQCGLSYAVATALSLLYTFLPYHIIRGQHHLFLSAYWQVPLFLAALLWIVRGELNWSQWRSWRMALVVAVCVLLGSSGFYYAFFACFFLLLAAALRFGQARQIQACVLPVALIGLISLLVVANLLPSILYTRQHGASFVVQRVAADADTYGLRLAQILLPVRAHRWLFLSDLKTEYNLRPLVNENDDAALGVVGAMGFVGLLGWFLFKRPRWSELETPGRAGLLNHLSMLTMLGFLLATIGGVGSLVAFFGLAQLRAYNRISVFLAFFCLLAVGLGLEQLGERWRQKLGAPAWFKYAFWGLLAALTWIGLLDQISPYFLPDYRTARLEYESDYNLVKQIEAVVPTGAMIFQLPVMSFPENPKIVRMNDYDLARPYLHSSHLRWSYGTIKGREDDFWVRRVASLPAPEMAVTLALAGFNGIFIDRFGYVNNAANYEAEFKALLNVVPINAPNGRQVFFDLTDYAKRLRAQMSPDEWQRKSDEAAHPVMALWQEGFSDQEGSATDYWRWCGARGQMQIVNRSNRAQEFTLEATFQTDADSSLQITGFLNEKLAVKRQGTPYARQISVPPGLHTIRFQSDARRVLPPNDFRELVFRVRNFKLVSVNASK